MTTLADTKPPRAGYRLVPCDGEAHGNPYIDNCGRCAPRWGWREVKLDAFTWAYIECALWSSTDESTPQGGGPLDSNYGIDDIAPESLGKMVADCEHFQSEWTDTLDAAGDDEQNGHDFWLTRNRHGAGFWDRGYGKLGDDLTEAAHAMGEVDLYVGDDGKVYQS